MSALLEDVYYLAGTIGPRGTGTPAEAAAADYVAERLADLGLVPEKHAIRSVPSQNAFPIAISLVTVLATLVYPLGWAVTRWLGALLSLAAGGLLWQTIRNAEFNPLMTLLPKVNSQNVEARLQPKDELRGSSGSHAEYRKIVILAHLDTNRCRLVWQSHAVRNIEPMTWLTLAIPFCMTLLYLAGAITGGMLWWWLSLPLAIYELGAIVILIRDDRTPYSPGAHDNAASVAVALEVATRLSAAPLQNTEVWFAFDGAEETDHAGTLDLLRRHGADLRDASFFGLEGLGSGELVYLTRQGICDHYRPTADLLVVAESVASKHPEFEFHPAQMLAEDDVRTLRGRGYHAIGIAGRDPQTGILPHWHRPDDTPDTVSEETMHRATDVMCAMLKEMDR
ncbi:MAG: M28 family peptidase [Chloroflexi bacterium]|nr:M28 family peptidase [Chloroflexota bacterium]